MGTILHHTVVPGRWSFESFVFVTWKCSAIWFWLPTPLQRIFSMTIKKVAQWEGTCRVPRTNQNIYMIIHLKIVFTDKQDLKFWNTNPPKWKLKIHILFPCIFACITHKINGTKQILDCGHDVCAEDNFSVSISYIPKCATFIDTIIDITMDCTGKLMKPLKN